MPNPRYKSSITTSFAHTLSTKTDEFSPGVITAVIAEDLAMLCGEENVRFYNTVDSCATNADIYAIADIQDPAYTVEEEYYENGFGQKYLKNRVVKTRMSVAFYADTFVRGKIYEMVSENDELMADLDGFTGKKIRNIAVESDEPERLIGGTAYALTIAFDVDDLADTGFIGCCREDVYAEAPYVDPCPPDDGGDPVACAAMSISLSIVGDVVTLTVTNPMPALQNVWTFTPIGGAATVIGTNVNMVTLPSYGALSVKVNSGTCVKTAGLSYTDPCTGFEVSITNIEGVLTAEVPDSFDPVDTYQWEYSADGGDWTALGTGSSQVASSGAGYYRVTVTKGDCSDDTIIYVDASDLCDIEGEIGVDVNDLTWTTASGETIISYQWAVDIGEGFVDIPGETNATHTATESGYYRIAVTFDNGCVVYYYKVHIMCSDCAAFGVEVTNAGDVITADVTGCADPEYHWYQVSGASKIEVGTDSNTYTLPADGIYFVAVCCLNCNTQVFLIVKSGSSITITDSKLTDQIAWGGL